MFWWTELGFPPFESAYDGFPRTGQVIKYYREQTLNEAGHVWTQKEFAKVLYMTEKTVGEIENRDATLEFDRRQLVCQLFDIPPLLLGIRTLDEINKIVEQERAKQAIPVVAPSTPTSPNWWQELAHPSFQQGHDGFPRSGQVIRHYRTLKRNNKGQSWTQRDLAQALGVSDQAAWDLENRDASMLDIDRRRILSDWFAIPPILLGIITLEEINILVEKKTATQPTTPIISTAPSTTGKLLIDIDEYESLLTNSWHTFILDPIKTSINDILLKMDDLYRELPHTREQKPTLALLCRYHDLVANLLRDQQQYNAAIEHCHKAFRLAQQLHSDELQALVLYEWGYTLWQADRLNEAQQKYEEARCYEHRLPTNLRCCLLLDASRVQGETAKTKDEKREAIALTDHVGNIMHRNLAESDPYFLHLNLDRYHLTRSATLIAVNHSKEAINQLKLVKVDPEHPRRQTCHDIYLAQAYLRLGEYDVATGLAESGLAIAQKIHSAVLIARIETLHHNLQRSPYQGHPDISRLDYMLRKRRTKK